MPRKDRKPPLKLRRKFAPLIALCREKIILAPPQTSGTGVGDKLITVTVKWPLKQGTRLLVPDIPKDFPTGVQVHKDDKCVVIRHNVVAVLKWFKAKYYTDYDAKDLFAARKPALLSLVRNMYWLEKDLDTSQFEAYNTHIESEE